MVEHNALLARYDLGAAHWGATNATTLSTRVLRDISLLGGTLAMILIASGVAIRASAVAATAAATVIEAKLCVPGIRCPSPQ
jgi:hypothetical protein